ncbi:variant erythrocyte surface antigen-1 family protein [Babesia caballi]|uniref:Variant erythrocyte surface antigen-1 family protein n=1 Tax=Babesia caballi TaxID=5871 RepID=A0AAV4LY12_BABCB|nr:variant erythrocyte surface antigen-1 family protein [Babesia caballi]
MFLYSPLSTSLSDCPSNLKEAIDWILRVTGKDGQDSGGQNGTDALTKEVKKLLPEVKGADTGLNQDIDKVIQALDGSGDLIGKLAEGLQRFIGYEDNGGEKIGTDGIAVGKNGQKPWNSPSDANKGGYYLSYNPNESGCQWDTVKTTNTDVTTCAKIFLSIIPLIWSALSYLYWRCRVGGSWSHLNLNEGALSPFLLSMWLNPSRLQKDKQGSHVATKALQKFQEFSSANSEKSYAEFLNKLREEGSKKWKEPSSSTATTNNFLSGLYFLSQAYFQHKQSRRPKEASKAPSTIRQMLYFWAALPFTAQFGELETYISNHFKGLVPNNSPGGPDARHDHELKLQVADSGKKSGSNTLSAADLKEYILTTSLFSAATLGVIQNPSSGSSEPFLHDLFTNGMNLKFPSAPSLFNTLSNYAYAVQFQLRFLLFMCSNYAIKCGWHNCKFGSTIYPKGANGATAQSHICPGLKCQDAKCNHRKGSSDCNHNNYSDSAGCGSEANPSALQSFLTDRIQGMCRAHPGSTENHLATCSGPMCHVPMGFKSTDLRGSSQGGYLYIVLGAFCSGSISPLHQLCEKFGCLTKRVPRSLGDLFGFFYHLSGQIFPKGQEEPAGQWFKSLVEHTPFSSAIDRDRGKLLALAGTGHGSHNSYPKDLCSLHLQVKSNHRQCYQSNANCGPYLAPLTLSNGATFGKTPAYASTYLSWLIYLTDDLEMGLRKLLDEFRNIDCAMTGCVGKNKCSKNHAAQTHGNITECSCDSVVHCGGVLPMIYRLGFAYNSTGDLFGESKTNTKRTCTQFSKQLQSVISGDPLSKLLTSIDTFLYAIRWEFFSKLSAFWTIYICLILYTFFFLLDTLHFRSHLKLTASPIVQPLALLTSGTPLPITKLTYITQ